MEAHKKWLTCLTLVLLVNNLQAEYIDYCKMEPFACASHTFDVSERDPNDSYSCLVTPLQYDNRTGSFNISGTEEKISATKVNETAVRCSLTEFQSGEVKLESTQDGIIGQPGFIYPKMCFECGSDKSNCNLKSVHQDASKNGYGCFTDGICYPGYVLHPLNSTLACLRLRDPDPHAVPVWIFLFPMDNSIKSLRVGISINTCTLDSSFAKNWARATAPEIAGREAIDLLADEAYIRYPPYSWTPLTYAFSLKFYVKFHREPVVKNTTFFELTSALKVQRRPDEALQVEYTFHDVHANTISKIVIQDVASKTVVDEYARNKKNADKRSPFGMKLNVTFEEKWTMIGLGYEMYGGSASVSFFVDGNKVNADVGDLTGLYLLTTKEFELKNAAFSCMEACIYMRDDEYFKEPNLPLCVTAVNAHPAEYYEDCVVEDTMAAEFTG